MAYEFKDMATVDVAESVSESAHVLIEDGGVIKRLSKEEVGSGTVKSVNGTSPDENGNVEISVAASWNDLADKPFGKEGVYTNIFTNKSVQFSSGNADLGVSWEDGVTYKLTIDDVSQVGTAYYQGNPVYAHIFQFDGGWEVSMGDFIANDVTDGEHLVTLDIVVEETVTKIDEEFLPELAGKVVIDGGEIFNDYSWNKATGVYSHAEGQSTSASGQYSHAEGNGSTAEGMASHAEGNFSHAIGDSSHAEGNGQAIGDSSHAEGTSTQAKGDYSHAEGNDTIASGECQHVQGKYNIEDVDSEGNALNTYAHIVGNGTRWNQRSNAHTLDWEGNAWFAGNIEGNACILKSSTEGSTKRFIITVDDSGAINATEITE